MVSRTRVALGALLLAAAGCSDAGEPGPSTGTSSGAAVTADAGTSEPGAKRRAAEACTEAVQCESNVCFVDRQSYCSLSCTAENATAVCVAPFIGTCNKKGFCKRAD